MSVGRRAASGGFLLSTGSAVATLLSAAGGVVVARLLTPSEYGIIGIALILPLTVSSLADLGFSSALVRFSSMGRGPEDYVATGLLFKLLTAILSGLLVFTLADQFSLILGRPYVAPMLKILSVYACSYTFIGAMAQILVGLGEYWKVTLVNCVQNLLRVTISIALILTGLGVYGAIWGFSVSYTVSAAIALLLLIKRVRTSCFSRFNRGAFREMLSYSLPLYVPVLLGVPVGQYFNMLLAWFTTDEEIGNYRIAANLLTPLSIIGGGISTALFSSFPLLVNEEYKLRDAVRKAAIYTSMIIVPLSLALIVFSEPATLLIYGDAYRLSPIYLSILALQGLLVPLGSAVIGPYLNSIGATRKTMKISLFNMLIGIPLATILVMDHGILGLIASSLLSGLASTTYALRVIYQSYSLKLNIRESSKPLAASAMALLLTHAVMALSGGFWARAIIGAIAYFASLLILLPALVDRAYIAELRNLASELKPIGRLASIALAMELKMGKLLQRRHQLNSD